METKVKYTIVIIHPETLQVLSAFHEKGIPLVFDTEDLAADYLKKNAIGPAYYKIDKYYILSQDGE